MEQKPVYRELQIPEQKIKKILCNRTIRKNGIIQKHKKIEISRKIKKINVEISAEMSKQKEVQRTKYKERKKEMKGRKEGRKKKKEERKKERKKEDRKIQIWERKKLSIKTRYVRFSS